MAGASTSRPPAPVREPFKILLSNLADITAASDVTPLFALFGKVVECSIKDNCGVLLMEDEMNARKAIHAIDGCLVNNVPMKCEEPVIKTVNGTIKLFVGNLAQYTTVGDVCSLFDPYGRVVECDVVRNYSFVHVQLFVDVRHVLRRVNGMFLNGNAVSVQISRSPIRPQPGMAAPMQCARCRNQEHWTSECPDLHADDVYHNSLLNSHRRSNRPYGMAQQHRYKDTDSNGSRPSTSSSTVSYDPWHNVNRLIQESPPPELPSLSAPDLALPDIQLRGAPPVFKVYSSWRNEPRPTAGYVQRSEHYAEQEKEDES